MPDDNLTNPEKIFDAIEKRDLDKLKRLIKDEKIDVDIQDENKTTPLIRACAMPLSPKSMEIANYLIEQGADKNHSNKYNNTPFIAIIENIRETNVNLSGIDFTPLVENSSFDQERKNFQALFEVFASKDGLPALQKLNESFKGKHKISAYDPIVSALKVGNAEIIEYLLSDSFVASDDKVDMSKDAIRSAVCDNLNDDTINCFNEFMKAGVPLEPILTQINSDIDDSTYIHTNYRLNALTSLFVKFNEKFDEKFNDEKINEEDVAKKIDELHQSCYERNITHSMTMQATKLSYKLLNFHEALQNAVASNEVENVENAFEILPRDPLYGISKDPILNIREERGQSFLGRVLKEACDKINPNPQIIAELLKNGADALEHIKHNPDIFDPKPDVSNDEIKRNKEQIKEIFKLVLAVDDLSADTIEKTESPSLVCTRTRLSDEILEEIFNGDKKRKSITTEGLTTGERPSKKVKTESPNTTTSTTSTTEVNPQERSHQV